MFASPLLFDRLGWRGVAAATPNFMLWAGLPFFAGCIAFTFAAGGLAAGASQAVLLGLVITGAILQVGGGPAANCCVCSPAGSWRLPRWEPWHQSACTARRARRLALLHAAALPAPSRRQLRGAPSARPAPPNPRRCGAPASPSPAGVLPGRQVLAVQAGGGDGVYWAGR